MHYWNQGIDPGEFIYIGEDDLKGSNDEEYDCDGHVNNCRKIERLIKVICDNMNQVELSMDEDTLSDIINDFNHCTTRHDSSKEFKWVYDSIVRQNVA